MSRAWFLLFVLPLLPPAVAADPPKKGDKPPPELGRVPFHRDYAAAVELAKKEKKPLFVLFDEVPG